MVPWYHGYHGTAPSPPQVAIYQGTYTSFSRRQAESFGRHRSVFRVNTRKTRLFQGPVRVSLCPKGTSPGSVSRIPGFLDPLPNKTESVSAVLTEPEEHGKGHFSGKSRLRTTQYSESCWKPAQPVSGPETAIPGHVARTRFSWIPGNFDPRGRLGPPESAVFLETAGFCREKAVSRVGFPARSQPSTARAELKSSILTGRKSPKPGFLMAFILFKGQF